MGTFIPILPWVVRLRPLLLRDSYARFRVTAPGPSVPRSPLSVAAGYHSRPAGDREKAARYYQ
jgi:hypothetical protein